jgi:hypothetical protein
MHVQPCTGMYIGSLATQNHRDSVTKFTTQITGYESPQAQENRASRTEKPIAFSNTQ